MWQDNISVDQHDFLDSYQPTEEIRRHLAVLLDNIYLVYHISFALAVCSKIEEMKSCKLFLLNFFSFSETKGTVLKCCFSSVEKVVSCLVWSCCKLCKQ